MKREANDRFMRIAIEEGKKGEGSTSPYPFVGCVIVKGSRVIASGHTQPEGKEHAEVNALKKLGGRAFGATLYSTLEPCHHNDYTDCESCSQWIARSGIKIVVWGTTDPNPKNQRGSTRWLRAQGVRVVTRVLEAECKKLHEIFLTSLAKQRPFVLLSTASSLDGKITWKHGASPVKFSSPEAMARVHRLRSSVDAICVGIRTVEIDNPRLTARQKMFRGWSSEHWKNPHRIVVDTTCRLSTRAQIFEAPSGLVYVLTTNCASVKNRRRLERAGAQVIVCGRMNNGLVDLADGFRRLYHDHRITSIMIEGGGELIASAFQQQLVDKLYFFYSSIIMGGRDTPTAVEGEQLKKFSDAPRIKELSVERVGSDILMSGYIKIE